MRKKIEVDKEKLYQLYIVENKRREDVAKEMGISIQILKRALSENNFKKDPQKIVELTKETNLQKYGHTCSIRASKLQEKRNKAMLDKYGSTSAFIDKSVYEKRNKTMLDKYGVKYIMQTEEGKSKLNWNSELQKQTMIDRYGVDNGFKMLDKIKETKLHKYNDENYNNHTKQRQTMIEKYGDAIHQKKAKKTLMLKYGVEYACLTENCINNNGRIISKVNKDFKELLDKNGIKSELEFRLNKYSFDLHILDTNILIEINPTYTHNVTKIAYFGKSSKCKKPLKVDYHFNKYKLAKDSGYQLISVFDWMDYNKVIDIIKSKIHRLSNRIDGHKCKIIEISQKEANEFLDKYHIQGRASNQSVCIGLFYKDELVQVQTFR